MSRLATERMTLEQAEEQILSSDRWLGNILARVGSRVALRPGMKVLDVGAAQGRTLIGLDRRGFEAYGVEPTDEARHVARELAEREGCHIVIEAGTAESLPFEADTFDLVIATSVMEHVVDLERSLAEIHRVLRPGGMFWFNSASAMSPFQNEITGFPLFGWYPDRLKRRIMLWARDRRPALVGHTDHPAMHWWTPRKADRKLREAGFVEIWDRWDLRRAEEQRGLATRGLALIQRFRAVRLLADVVVPGCSYAARKAI